MAWSTVCTLVSGAHVELADGCNIVSTLTDSGLGAGGFAQSVFFATRTGLGTATTLNSAPTVGAYTLDIVADNVAVGDTIQVSRGSLIVQCFTVLSRVAQGRIP